MKKKKEGGREREKQCVFCVWGSGEIGQYRRCGG